jgi:hypothetical protein
MFNGSSAFTGKRPRLTRRRRFDIVSRQLMIRGDLPPIAATLNNVLKRDAPGGLLSPGRFVFVERQSPFHGP